jgi:glycosyltransferase involved in cell wall biosynthesis
VSNLKGAGLGASALASDSAAPKGEAPSISVIIIFLNAGRFIKEAIESILAQDFSDFEILLVDDGSTDASSAIARTYVENRPKQIFYLEHDQHQNRGMSASRNLGIRFARGSYITFCDADDSWPPKKLSQQMEVFARHPEVGMVCGAAKYWRSWDNGEDEIVRCGHIQDTPINPPEACLEVYPLGNSAAAFNSLLVRREIVAKVGGFEDAFTGLYDDQAFICKVYLEAVVYFSSLVWLNYRQHAESSVSVAHGRRFYHAKRRFFLEWFKRYVSTLPMPPDPGLQAAIDRALARYQRPTAYFIGRLPRRILNRLKRIMKAHH